MSAPFLFTTQKQMRNDYYFDDLDIENFFIDDERESGLFPTRAGQVSTRPQGITERTAPRMDADGKLRDKLKKFAQSDKGKKLIKIYAGVGVAAVLVAAGPAILTALAPVLPAMKALLAKQGIKAKGLKDVLKKFTETQIKLEGDEKKDPKKIVSKILDFFKAAKERRAAGTASELDNLVLKTADETIQKISDGTLTVDGALEVDEAPAAGATPGRTKEATVTTEKKGIDMKIILIALVAIFLFAKK